MYHLWKSAEILVWILEFLKFKEVITLWNWATFLFIPVFKNTIYWIKLSTLNNIFHCNVLKYNHLFSNIKDLFFIHVCKALIVINHFTSHQLVFKSSSWVSDVVFFPFKVYLFVFQTRWFSCGRGWFESSLCPVPSQSLSITSVRRFTFQTPAWECQPHRYIFPFKVTYEWQASSQCDFWFSRSPCHRSEIGEVRKRTGRNL